MTLAEFKSKEEKVLIGEYPTQVEDNPMISICVQTFQQKNYIRNCLDGILMQKVNFTYEVLLGEDESNDGTREICIEYAEKFPNKIRLFLHRRENNIKIEGKASGRFNFLYNLHSANGKYIALCEGDDYWTDPFKLQKQFDYLEANKEYVLCAHQVDSLIADKRIKRRKICSNPSSTYLLIKNFIPTLSIFFRKKSLLPHYFDVIRYCIVGDFPLLYLIGKHGKFKIFSESMGVYRINNGGTYSQNTLEKKYDLNLKVLSYMQEYIEEDHMVYYNTGVNRQLIFRAIEKKILSKEYQKDLNQINLNETLSPRLIMIVKIIISIVPTKLGLKILRNLFSKSL